jgi:hypothetical protein
MLDLTECVKTSRRFYRDHELRDWARAIPKSTAMLGFHDSALALAEKAGFTAGFAFPHFALQLEQFSQLVEATAMRPAPGLSDSEQYSCEVVLSDAWNTAPTGQVLQRTDDLAARIHGAYVYLFSPEPYATAWGRTGRQIQELFFSRGWQGLTVPEYFVLQRYSTERFGDHRFFAEPLDDKRNHSLWLIDSMNETDCSVVIGSPRGINVQACKATNRDSRRATVAGMVMMLPPLAA